MTVQATTTHLTQLFNASLARNHFSRNAIYFLTREDKHWCSITGLKGKVFVNFNLLFTRRGRRGTMGRRHTVNDMRRSSLNHAIPPEEKK